MAKILIHPDIFRYFIQFSGALVPAPPKNPEIKRDNSYITSFLFLDSSGAREASPLKIGLNNEICQGELKFWPYRVSHFAQFNGWR